MITVIMRLITGEWSYGAAAIDAFLLIILTSILFSAGEDDSNNAAGEIVDSILGVALWFCLYKSLFSLTYELSDLSVKTVFSIIGLSILCTIALFIPSGLVWYHKLLEHWGLITMTRTGWIITIVVASIVGLLEIIGIIVLIIDARSDANPRGRK